MTAGLSAAYFTFVTMTLRYFESQNWQSTYTKIDSVKLKSHRGEDSTTYQVIAQYRYQFNGLSYSNHQVSLNDKSDNIGDYWQRLYHRLEKDRSRDQAIAWVNPDNPNDAILDREFRWEKVAFGSLFVLIFGMVGAGMIWLSLKPTQDPFANATQGIASQEKGSHVFIFYFGLVFFLIGALLSSFAIPSALRTGEYGAFILLAFMAVGAWVMYLAQSKKKIYQTIGASPLFLDPLPGAIGGQIGGYFNLGLKHWRQPLDVKVSCLSERKSGKKTYYSTLWQEQARVYCQDNGNGMRNSFSFNVPEHLPASRGWQDNSRIEWEIKSTGMLIQGSQAIEFKRSWIIPAEHSTASSQIEQHIPESYKEQQAEAALAAAKLSANQQIDLTQNHDGLNITSPAGRHLNSAIGTFLMGLICLGSGTFTIMQNWYPGYVFILIGIICTLLGLFLAGRKITTRINTQSRFLQLRRSWFNIGLYSREVALFSAKQFELQLSSSTTQGSDLTEYFKLIVNSEVPKAATAEHLTMQRNARTQRKNTDDASGTYATLSLNKQYTFAEGISGRQAAQAMLEQIIEQVF